MSYFFSPVRLFFFAVEEHRAKKKGPDALWRARLWHVNGDFGSVSRLCVLCWIHTRQLD